MALDLPRKTVSQVGNRLQRQQRILGQRVIHSDRTPTETRSENIMVQPEHRTGSNNGHVLTLPRAAQPDQRLNTLLAAANPFVVEFLVRL